MPFSSDHIKDLCSDQLTTAVLALITWLRQWLLVFLLQRQSPHPLNLLCTMWVECVDPHILVLGPDLAFLVGKEPTEVTWNASAKEICLHHLFSLVLLFFLFLISTGCEYLVYSLGQNLISHFSCSNCSSSGHWVFFRCTLASGCYVLIRGGLCVRDHVLYFLAPQDAPGSSCMFPVPVL